MAHKNRQEDGMPSCSGTDGVAALEIAFAARESARQSCIVNLRRA